MGKNKLKAKTILAYANLILDEGNHSVFRGDDRVILTPTQSRLFGYFIRHAGSVLSRRELLRKVWGIAAPLKTRTVDMHISILRRKLRLEKQLVTVPRQGYRLNADEKIG